MKGIAIAAAAALLLCAGCASVTQGSTHPLRIETETATGEMVDGAHCTLTNDQGTTVTVSGMSSPVRRSSQDLEITCAAPNLPDAGARLLSRANAGLAGNIILGGVVGAVIDHNSGAAYTYPSWVRLVFGEYAVLDRRDEQDGRVLKAAAGTTTKIVGSRSPVPAAAVTAGSDPAKGGRTAGGNVAPPPSGERRGAALARGDRLEYEWRDRSSNRVTPVLLNVERVDSQLLFNGGARVEGLNGDVLAGKGILGEIDSVTPSEGWAPSGRPPQGAWQVKFSTGESYPRSVYDLRATTGPQQVLRLAAGEFPAYPIYLDGWLERSAGSNGGRAPYRAVVWYSPELRRPVKFEAQSRVRGNSTGTFHIDETIELRSIERGLRP